MSTNVAVRARRSVSAVAVLVALLGCEASGRVPVAVAARPAVAPEPAAAPADSTPAVPSGIHAAIAADEQRITPYGERFHAVNRTAGLRVWFGVDGSARVTPRTVDDETAPGVALRLAWYGREDARVAAAAPGVGEGRCLDERRKGTDGRCLGRLEIARPGLVEWYDNGPKAVEHGFDLAERPAGQGPLVLALQVEGGGAVQRGDEVLLVAGDEDVAVYRGLVVRDAAGTERGGALVADAGTIRLVVSDEGLVYPLVVDPWLVGPATTLESNQANAMFGTSVAGAGDVNGDGYADILVGAPNFGSRQLDEGRVYVYLGSAAGIATDAAPAATLESNQEGARFGVSVAGAGDVNGDGYAGTPGSAGHGALLVVDGEVGAACDAYGNGGQRIRAGVDLDDDATLADGEVETTTYVCHGSDGADGLTSLVAQASEPPGAACPDGGVRLDFGLDANGDGVLDAAEVVETRFVCDGEPGTPGSDGEDGTPGSDGEDGTPGSDGEDGTPGRDGKDGAPGGDGAAGAPGLATLVATGDEPPGSSCAEGGVRIDSGLDQDGDGRLQPAEVTATSYVCQPAAAPSSACAATPGSSAFPGPGPAPLAALFALALALAGLRVAGVRRQRRRRG